MIYCSEHRIWFTGMCELCRRKGRYGVTYMRDDEIAALPPPSPEPWQPFRPDFPREEKPT